MTSNTNTMSETNPTTEETKQSKDDNYEAFVRLYAKYEPQIRAFLRSLLPSWQDVDEVIQDVALTIWKKFDQFDQSTEFMRWVCVISRFEVLNYRRKKARNRLVFNDEIFEMMAEEGQKEMDQREEEFAALNHCLETLPEKQREMIDCFYMAEMKTEELAEKLKTNVNTLYVRLSRTRKALSECVKTRIQMA